MNWNNFWIGLIISIVGFSLILSIGGYFQDRSISDSECGSVTHAKTRSTEFYVINSHAYKWDKDVMDSNHYEEYVVKIHKAMDNNETVCLSYNYGWSILKVE